MGFPLLPFIGQIITVEGSSGELEGILVSISQTEFVIKPPEKPEETYPLAAIRTARFNFSTFEDAIKHLADGGEARHCSSCYIGLLYAVEFLSIDFSSQPFVARADAIRRGIISFLLQDFPSAGYSLLPQAEGIITQILHEDGLLKHTKTFPKWTKEHPDDKYHGKQCTNFVSAIEGAAAANEASRLRHVEPWLKTDRMEAMRQLRNKLLHGSMLEVSEHETSSIIILLQAVHHGVTENAE